MDALPEPKDASRPSQQQSQEAERASQRRAAERGRKRAARACTSCRRQKEKCDGGVPCRRCVRLRKQCEVPRREPRGSTRYRDAESHHGDLGQDAESTERIKHLEKLLQHYAGDVSLDHDNLRAMADAVDTDHPVPRGQPSASPDSQQSEYLGAGEEDITVQPLGNNITHYSGEFSHWNFSMRIKQWIEQCANDAPDGLKFKEYYRAEDLRSKSSTFAPLSTLPPRFVADFLVQAFFTHAEMNYFYVGKEWLLKKLDVVYGNPGAMTKSDVGTVCVLFMVFAVGTQYAYLDSPPQEGQDADAGGGFSEDAVGVSFYQQACQLVPDVIMVSSLESVQACLLIGVYTLPLDASGLSWIYLNLAVKLAIQNGMHRRHPAGGLDPVVQETRNRVWWTAYTTEKRVAIFHGRPIAIDTHDVDAKTPVDCPSILLSHNSTHIPSMLATLELHQILGKISQEISRLKSHPDAGAVETLGRLVELDKDLHRWWNALPDAICRKVAETSSSLRRSEVHLRLEYCLVRMFIGRPFIFLGGTGRSSASNASPSADTAHSSPDSQRPRQRKTSSSQSQSSRRSVSRSILVKDCVDAALDIVDACKTLRSTIGLARASYTEFSGCRAALLVIITQCLQGRTPKLRSALRDGVAMLKHMSSGGESARSEASLIEVLERAIARLDGAEVAAAVSSESDYSRFKKWEMLWKNELAQTPASREPGTSDVVAPIPPSMAGFWEGNGSNLSQAGPLPMQVAPSSVTPMDWSFAEFPQIVDEFSSMFGHGLGPSPDSTGDQTQAHAQSDMWMGS